MKNNNRKKIICIFIVFLLAILGFSINSFGFENGDDVKTIERVDVYEEIEFVTSHKEGTISTRLEEKGEWLANTKCKYLYKSYHHPGYAKVEKEGKQYVLKEEKLSKVSDDVTEKNNKAAREFAQKYTAIGGVFNPITSQGVNDPLNSLSTDEFIKVMAKCNGYIDDGCLGVLGDLPARIKEQAKKRGLPIVENSDNPYKTELASVVSKEVLDKQKKAEEERKKEVENTKLDEGGWASGTIYKLPERTGSSDTDDIDGTIAGAEDFVKDAKSGGVRSSSYKKYTECFKVHL